MKIIPRSIFLLIAPIILLFVAYIHLNGEHSPGGGFQSGAIFAACTVLCAMLDIRPISKYICVRLASLGVFFYFISVMITNIINDLFDLELITDLRFDLIQKISIFLIEAGVGLTVCSVMLIIFCFVADD